MWPGGSPEGENETGLLTQNGGSSVVTPDDKNGRRPAFETPGAQMVRNDLTRGVGAAFVKNHHNGAVRYRLHDRFGFFLHAQFGIVGAAFANFDNVDGGDAGGAATISRT